MLDLVFFQSGVRCLSDWAIVAPLRPDLNNPRSKKVLSYCSSMDTSITYLNSKPILSQNKNQVDKAGMRFVL